MGLLHGPESGSPGRVAPSGDPGAPERRAAGPRAGVGTQSAQSWAGPRKATADRGRGRPPRTQVSALRGSRPRAPPSLGPAARAPELALSGSRLAPSRLLLRLLRRLKTATVPELTPGDPGRFLPAPSLTGTLCSQLSSGRPRLCAPTLSPRRSPGIWPQVKPTAAGPAHLCGGREPRPLPGGPDRQTLLPSVPSPPLGLPPGLQAKSVDRKEALKGKKRKPHPSQGPEGREGAPPWFLRLL